MGSYLKLDGKGGLILFSLAIILILVVMSGAFKPVQKGPEVVAPQKSAAILFGLSWLQQ